MELNDEIADEYVTHAAGVSRCLNPASQQMPVESDANGYVDHANNGCSGSLSILLCVQYQAGMMKSSMPIFAAMIAWLLFQNTCKILHL